MEVLLTHNSALQYWRIHEKAREDQARHQRARKAPATPPDNSVVLQGNLFGLSLPLEVTVSSANSRRTSLVLKSYAFPEIFPDRCLVNIGDGFLVASPELCFFQLASKLPLVKLIELGYELCGSYALPASKNVDDGSAAEIDTLYNLNPLSSTKKLAAFVNQMSGRHGVKKALKALQYIADDSASPMESILAILLVLPYRLGGYGFPLPEMNRKIDPKAAIKKSSSKRFYKCDLLWSDFAVAAEYDSSLHHSGLKNIASDSIRRGELVLSGIEVVTVTDKQIYGIEEFNKVARQLALKMGKRIQIRDPKFTTKRRELRSVLL